MLEMNPETIKVHTPFETHREGEKFFLKCACGWSREIKVNFPLDGEQYANVFRIRLAHMSGQET